MSFIINRISNMSIVPPNILEKRSSELSLNFSGSAQRHELFNLKTVQIRNAKKQSFHEQKIFLAELILNGVNFFVICLTVFKNFRKHDSIDKNDWLEDWDYENEENQIVQYRILLAFSIFAVLTNIAKYLSERQLKEQSQRKQKESSFSSKFISKMVLTSIFYLIHPSSFTHNIVITFLQPQLDVNKILSCVVYMRFFTGLLFLLKLSKFYGLRVNRVLGLYVGDEKQFGTLYTIKCFLKENGLKSPFLIYATIITVVPFFIICFRYGSSSQYEDFTSSAVFLQSIYDIIISMSTIGYGDLSHSYSIQRVIFVIIIVIGSFTSSFFTLTFLNWFRLSQQQEKALRSIKRLDIKSQIALKNNEKIHGFVEALAKLKKKRKRELAENKATQSNPSKLAHEFEHNQILSTTQESKHQLKSLIPKTSPAEVKYLNQRLYDTRDTFKDFYERSQLQLSQSIKILIERTLLTNNLLQFYLMRQKSIKSERKSERKSQKGESSIVSDSSQTIKSRKRVDDNAKLYELRLNIVKSTYHQENEQGRAQQGTKQKDL